MFILHSFFPLRADQKPMPPLLNPSKVHTEEYLIIFYELFFIILIILEQDPKRILSVDARVTNSTIALKTLFCREKNNIDIMSVIDNVCFYGHNRFGIYTTLPQATP